METICLQKYEITTKYDPRRCYKRIALQIYKKLEITEIFLVQFTDIHTIVVFIFFIGCLIEFQF